MQILLAEDEADIRKLVQMGMRLNAMSVEAVSNGREAVELAEEKQWDLIMLDLNMPELNGVDAAMAIRQMDDHVTTPILFLSGDDQRIELGVENSYRLAKPFTISELCEKVRSVTANSTEPT